jgi:hypothetical protein
MSLTAGPGLPQGEKHLKVELIGKAVARTAILETGRGGYDLGNQKGITAWRQMILNPMG